MKVTSWNVWSLSDLDRKYTLCQVLTSIGEVDILRLQEVKIARFLLSMALSKIWLGTKCVFSNHSNGRGGGAPLISPQLTNIVVEGGSNLTKRLVQVLLNLDRQLLALANIYTSNDMGDEWPSTSRWSMSYPTPCG